MGAGDGKGPLPGRSGSEGSGEGAVEGQGEDKVSGPTYDLLCYTAGVTGRVYPSPLALQAVH